MIVDISSFFRNNELMIDNSTVSFFNDTHQCFLSVVQNEPNKKSEIFLTCTLIQPSSLWSKIRTIISYIFNKNCVMYAPFLLDINEAQNMMSILEKHIVFCKNQDSNKKGKYLTRKEAHDSAMQILLDAEERRKQQIQTEFKEQDTD